MKTVTIHCVRCYCGTGDLIGTRFEDKFNMPYTAQTAAKEAAEENACSERRRKLKMPGAFTFAADSFQRGMERVA